MTRSGNLKKLLISVACVVTLLVGSASMAFAADTKVLMEVPATGIDFEVSEQITMTGAAESTDLTVEDLEVTNLSDVGVINIDSVEATAETGWELVNQSTDWAKLAANAGKFGLATGNHDMATGAYTAAGTVNPTETATVSFTGNTGLVTTAINGEQVATIVVTVSYVTQ